MGFSLEMGLGKSLLALEEFKRESAERNVTRLVVVSPNSFKTRLARGDRQTRDSILSDAYVYVSGATKRNDTWLSTTNLYSAPPILVVNYEADPLEGGHASADGCGCGSSRRCCQRSTRSIQIKTHD